MATADDVRLITFYLPQYHPIPENDAWWGKGFTEWRNVVKARPRFPGHYQPHIPADLGFYDLRIPEVRDAQAELAREYGIDGFCYYHYWFNGRRLLQRPFEEVLASGKPDLPFCLCWANENWTRIWDGSDQQILMQQVYNACDDRAHIRSLIPAFEDNRYIRVGGKPIFLVYRAELLPNPKETTAIWREEAARAGIGDLYLVRVEHFIHDVDPRDIGFDAAVEFAPEGPSMGWAKYQQSPYRWLLKLGLLPEVYLNNRVGIYDYMVDRMLGREFPDYVRFRCVTPGFDNVPRHATNALILQGTPEKYREWLSQTIAKTIKRYAGNERLVFINAWNEWAEGNHLEPDQLHGRGFLEATLEARSASKYPSSGQIPRKAHKDQKRISGVKKLYWRGIAVAKAFRDAAGHVLGRSKF